MRLYLTKFRIITGLAVLLLITAAGLTWWLIRDDNATPYKYTYSKTGTIKLDGAKTGAGTVLQKPIEFLPVGNVNDQARNYAQDIKVKGHVVSIGGLSISTTPLEKSLSATTVDVINSGWQYQSDDVYQPIYKVITNFVKNNSAPRYSVSLTNPKAFSNPSIAKNAWQLDLKLSDNQPAEGQTEQMTGKATYVIGQKAIYYYALAAVNYNWQANSLTWQQMLKSIKIDQ